MGKKQHPLAARIKKIMQADEDVGKIAQITPFLIGRAMELFLEKLCTNAGEIATSRSAKTVSSSHVKAYVHSDKLMDFLKDTVASAPDLREGEEIAAPKPKRQRRESSETGGGSGGGGRGRGRSGEGGGRGRGRAAKQQQQQAAASAGNESDEKAEALPESEASVPTAPSIAVQAPAAAVAAEQPPCPGGAAAAPAPAAAAHGAPGLTLAANHPFLKPKFSFGKISAGGVPATATPATSQPEQQGGADVAMSEAAEQLPGPLEGHAQAANAPGASPFEDAAAQHAPPGMVQQALETYGQAGAAAGGDYDDDYEEF